MPQWKPNEDLVENDEIVARRIFAKPGEVLNPEGGSKGPPGGYRLDHFYEKRLDADLSLDRLGKTKPRDHVLTHLRPKCEQQALAVRKPFDGWATAKRNTFGPRFPIDPTPDEEQDNPFHCDLRLKDYSSVAARESAAFRLAWMFKTDDWLKSE